MRQHLLHGQPPDAAGDHDQVQGRTAVVSGPPNRNPACRRRAGRSAARARRASTSRPACGPRRCPRSCFRGHRSISKAMMAAAAIPRMSPSRVDPPGQGTHPTRAAAYQTAAGRPRRRRQQQVADALPGTGGIAYEQCRIRVRGGRDRCRSEEVVSRRAEQVGSHHPGRDRAAFDGCQFVPLSPASGGGVRGNGESLAGSDCQRPEPAGRNPPHPDPLPRNGEREETGGRRLRVGAGPATMTPTRSHPEGGVNTVRATAGLERWPPLLAARLVGLRPGDSAGRRRRADHGRPDACPPWLAPRRGPSGCSGVACHGRPVAGLVPQAGWGTAGETPTATAGGRATPSGGAYDPHARALRPLEGRISSKQIEERLRNAGRGRWGRPLPGLSRQPDARDRPAGP